MSKIYHIAVKVPDVNKAKAFYKDVFGFEELKQSKVRDHISCHLTDGVIDLAIVEYDSEGNGLRNPFPAGRIADQVPFALRCRRRNLTGRVFRPRP